MNKALFEVGMPFCNVDYELETKHTPEKLKRIIESPMYKKYLDDPKNILLAIETMKSSISYSLFGELVDLDELKMTLASHHIVDLQTLSLCYAIVIISERFLNLIPDIDEILQELNELIDETPDCPQKVSSLILLADYYHFNFKIESAWRCTFMATSIAYALGLHVKSSKVWSMLVLHDALLCAVLSRPSSIKHVDPKLLCRVSNNWGEIALLLRECNEVSLTLQSSRSIERVISLDIRCDELIQSTRKSVRKAILGEDVNEAFLGNLKLCILTANRIKLLFPIYHKYKALKAQLDENCSELANALKGTLELLSWSGSATKENPYSLRSHCFFAYCSVFQGFLFHFLFASTDVADDSSKTGKGYLNSDADIKDRPDIPQSLLSVSNLLLKYDSLAGSINFCVYMCDVFDSFRALLNQRRKQKQQSRGHKLAADGSSECSENTTPISSNSRENEKVAAILPIMSEELPDWLTTCFSEGLFE